MRLMMKVQLGHWVGTHMTMEPVTRRTLCIQFQAISSWEMIPLVMKCKKSTLKCIGDVMALPSPVALSTNPDNNDPVILMVDLGNCFQAAYAVQQDTLLAITPNIAGIQNSSQTALSR
eukprot:171132-Ditylum_brightwellii.AAC.1